MEIKTFYVEVKKALQELHTYFRVLIGDFNAKLGDRKNDMFLNPKPLEIEMREREREKGHHQIIKFMYLELVFLS